MSYSKTMEKGCTNIWEAATKVKEVKVMVINGVEIINFPCEIIDGEEFESLHVGVLVEHIVKYIPEEAKAAVTIDASEIPDALDRLVREQIGMLQIEEIDKQAARERELELIALLEREGLL